MATPTTLESLKKSATVTLIRKYREVFGDPSEDVTRNDMIAALWQHYSEAGEEQGEPRTVSELLDEGYAELTEAIAADITEDADAESQELGEKYHRILDANDVRTIRGLRASGVAYAKIASEYGVSHTFIRNIVMRRLYKDVK